MLVGSYLLTAFSGAALATEVQVMLFAVVVLLTLRTSPLPKPWPMVITAVTVVGSAYRTPDRPKPEPSGGRRLPEDVDGSGDDEDRD